MADVLCAAGYGGAFQKIALPDGFMPRAGSAAYLRRLNGLDVESVTRRILAATVHRQSAVAGTAAVHR